MQIFPFKEQLPTGFLRFYLEENGENLALSGNNYSIGGWSNI